MSTDNPETSNQKPATRKSDKPYSYRPQKSDEAAQKFLADLLEKNGGNRNQAIEYCVKLAMGQPVPIGANPEAINKLQLKVDAQVAATKEISELHQKALQEVDNLKSQLSELKTQDSGLTTQLSEAGRERLAKVLKHRSKLKDELEALEYCILYTAKNDWL